VVRVRISSLLIGLTICNARQILFGSRMNRTPCPRRIRRLLLERVIRMDIYGAVTKWCEGRGDKMSSVVAD